MGAASSSEEVSLTLTNTQQESEESSTEKIGLLGESLRHWTVRQFTVYKWRLTPLSSAGFLAMGLLFLIGVTGCSASFPRDDSKLWEKLVVVLMVLPHSLFCIVLFVASVATWADPYKLMFDGEREFLSCEAWCARGACP